MLPLTYPFKSMFCAEKVRNSRFLEICPDFRPIREILYTLTRIHIKNRVFLCILCKGRIWGHLLPFPTLSPTSPACPPLAVGVGYLYRNSPATLSRAVCGGCPLPLCGGCSPATATPTTSPPPSLASLAVVCPSPLPHHLGEFSTAPPILDRLLSPYNAILGGSSSSRVFILLRF